jgi:hypothetical protein
VLSHRKEKNQPICNFASWSILIYAPPVHGNSNGPVKLGHHQAPGPPQLAHCRQPTTPTASSQNAVAGTTRPRTSRSLPRLAPHARMHPSRPSPSVSRRKAHAARRGSSQADPLASRLGSARRRLQSHLLIAATFPARCPHSHALPVRLAPLRFPIPTCSTKLLPGEARGPSAMVFKGRFFSSWHKSSESSSPDGSNSPRTPTSAYAASPASSSSSRSDKKKTKSETPRKRDKLFGSASVAAAAAPRSVAPSVSSSPAGDGRKGPSPSQLRDAGGGASAAALSPILASSLGLNRIKTRSGPLPQEGQRIAAALGSSSLSRGQAQSEPSPASVGGRKGGSSWADSSSSSSTNRGKGKASELPLRSATGASSGAEGKSAVKGSNPAPLHFSLEICFGILQHDHVSLLLIRHGTGEQVVEIHDPFISAYNIRFVMLLGV